MSSIKSWILVAAGLVAASGAAWALWGGSPGRDESVVVPEAFTAQSMQQQMDKSEELTKLFSSKQYKELTEEQRQQVGQNKAQAYRRMWDDRVDEYFAAGDSERNAVLDRHLDALVVQMKQYNKAAKEKPGDENTEQEKAAKRPFGQWTRQQRKTKSESGNPDEMARIMSYKSAMMNRAQTRGIDLSGGKGK